jgi:hypothetical protein
VTGSEPLMLPIGRQPLMLPLDHRNAVMYYAHGLALPRAALPRYRPDLLEVSPHRLPLLVGGVSPSVASLCAPDPTHFPVVLELDERLTIEGEEMVDGGTRVAVAAALAVPVGHVVRVHVRSEGHLEELRARAYRNIDGAELPLVVSPDVFDQPGPSADRLVGWLRSLPTPAGSVAARLPAFQSAGGGLQLLASVPNAAGLSGAVSAMTRTVLESQPTDPASTLVDAVQAVGWLDGPEDPALLAAVLTYLIADGGPPIPGDVIPAVLQQLGSEAHPAPAEVDAQLRYILDVSRGDAPLPRLGGHAGPRTTGALLLFLLRPEPEAVLTWWEEDIDAGPEVLALATLLAGVSCRFSGLSTGHRAMPELCHAVLDWIAVGCGLPVDALPHRPYAATGREPGPPRTAGDSVEQVPGATASILRTTWTTSLTDSDDLAIGVASALGWEDCIETVIDGPTMRIEPVRGGVRAVFPGVRSVRQRLLVDAFAARLDQLDDRQLADALERAATSTGRPGRRRRR